MSYVTHKWGNSILTTNDNQRYESTAMIHVTIFTNANQFIWIQLILPWIISLWIDNNGSIELNILEVSWMTKIRIDLSAIQYTCERKNLPLSRRFRLKKRLGSGCEGEVYSACDLYNNRDVAIKILSRNLKLKDSQSHVTRYESFLKRVRKFWSFNLIVLILTCAAQGYQTW